MEIKYRLYPHPVLWNKNDDYVNSIFDCSVDTSRDIKKLVVKLGFSLENEELRKMIESEKAEYLMHIECPSTSYRTLVKSGYETSEVSIADENLMGKVSLCPFIVAKEDLDGYTNKNFNEDYDGAKFDIQRGSILAIGDPFKFTISKENEELSEVPSIFTVYKKETVEECPMEVELNSDKIRVGFNIPDYEKYSATASSMPGMVNAINASVLFPTLVYTFGELKNGIGDYEYYRWFQAMKRIFRKNSMELNEDLLEKYSSIELAQKIMNMPVSKSLSNIADSADISEDE